MRKRGEETAPASAGGAPAVLALGELGGEPGQEVVDLVHDVAARPEREALRRDVPRRQARRGRRGRAPARWRRSRGTGPPPRPGSRAARGRTPWRRRLARSAAG